MKTDEKQKKTNKTYNDMKKLLTMLFVFVPLLSMGQGNLTMKRVSVHDPSIVWQPNTQTWYIFGSHRAVAFSRDLMSWNTINVPWANASSNNTTNRFAFTTQEVTTVTIGGTEVPFANFNAHSWSAAYGGDYNIDGNMWAPDVIWNEKMQKWCMYLSINGPKWNSSIILLTSERITGPYRYQAPVIISGFNVSNNDAVSYKKTDLEMVIGTQGSLPSRYNRGDRWGNYLPHCIDPCVFYDEEGVLWMSYGSWSGGIWMIRLNESTGLRDYDTSYPISGSDQNMKSDPYFGTKIAGGYYVSGEASYIEHIGDYYYLFVTYGGLEQAGGYQMRVFRSERPDGPYTDPKGTNAIFTRYALNFGPNSDTRGENIFGAYGSWGNMSDGERSQGHNSIVAAEDGRTYLVYHTRFQNGGEGHQVRVHQTFVNKDGWLCAAPFEYTGETVTDEDIATKEMFSTEYLVGDYKLLLHRYGLDHANKALVTPVDITLNSDGSISGSRTGTWEMEKGTCYMTLKINNIVYKGVCVMQTMEPKRERAVCFTGVSNTGSTAWTYKSVKEEPDGIAEVNQTSRHGDGGIYDLQGRKVGLSAGQPTTKGIYIRNGKKFVVK